jgi:hypothetical protein
MPPGGGELVRSLDVLWYEKNGPGDGWHAVRSAFEAIDLCAARKELYPLGRVLQDLNNPGRKLKFEPSAPARPTRWLYMVKTRKIYENIGEVFWYDGDTVILVDPEDREDPDSPFVYLTLDELIKHVQSSRDFSVPTDAREYAMCSEDEEGEEEAEEEDYDTDLDGFLVRSDAEEEEDDEDEEDRSDGVITLHSTPSSVTTTSEDRLLKRLIAESDEQRRKDRRREKREKKKKKRELEDEGDEDDDEVVEVVVVGGDKKRTRIVCDDDSD